VTTSPTIVQALEAGRSPEVAICLDGVSKAYKLYDRPFDFFKEALTGRSYHRDKVVLSDISLTLKRGEILGIIGRNGAGKSTLLKIIAGTLAPTQGAVTVNGRVAAILELGTGFNPNYSGRDNVILSALMRGMSEDAMGRKFDSIVAFAGLEDVIDEPFHTYSSGMQARLAFAAATAVEADVLVIDEALAAGDIRFASRSLRRIREICQSGVTALFVSHVTYHVMQLCSRVIWIDDGRIRMDGAPVDVVRAYEYAMHEAIARDDGHLVLFEAENAKKHAKTLPAALTLAQAPSVPSTHVSEWKTAPTVPVPPTAATSRTNVSTGPRNANAAAGLSKPGSSSQVDVDATLELGTLSESPKVIDPAKAPDADGRETPNGEPAVKATPKLCQTNDDELTGTGMLTKIQHFSIGQYRIGEIVFLDKNGNHTNTFRFGESMRMKVSYECLSAEVPEYPCGLAVAFNRVSDFEAVMYYNTNYLNSDDELKDYFNAPFRQYLGRTGQVEALIEPLQLRAGEYFVSLGILPNQLAPHEFYKYIRCRSRINVVANGFDEPSIFYPVVRWTNGPIGE
jgi:ABC-type polysaccharide/polyol phosphate transport system ATPase subunit